MQISGIISFAATPVGLWARPGPCRRRLGLQCPTSVVDGDRKFNICHDDDDDDDDVQLFNVHLKLTGS